VFSFTSNQSELVLDASSEKITPLVAGYNLQINMPVGQLSTGDYYILLDYGNLLCFET
jgi:hypothetical protein